MNRSDVRPQAVKIFQFCFPSSLCRSRGWGDDWYFSHYHHHRRLDNGKGPNLPPMDTLSKTKGTASIVSDGYFNPNISIRLAGSSVIGLTSSIDYISNLYVKGNSWMARSETD